ncbi:glycosyltransferase [Streptacidiphilus anmyonensis]|uniref:glycosyltransferase n=1 Tax=Streptacidiphilus anmyonensis TaxID=405782 RepID=UPI0005A901FB|nr:glycosyltransferase [Streptacidiphilus anmyonensis]
MSADAAVTTGRDIFIISNSVDELGGVTTWSHQMARMLTARGHHVHVLGICDTDTPADLGPDLPYPTTTLHPGKVPAVFSPRGVKQRLKVSGYARNSQREAAIRGMKAKLDALFAAARPGAMIIVTQVWAMEFVRLADRGSIPLIGMSHESYEYSQDSSRFARVKKYYPEADRLLLLTQEDADLWILEKLNNVGFMPNPLPVWPDEPSRRETKTVACIGRLDDQKGIDMLLDAWALAAPQAPGWTLKLYGKGEDEAELRAQCTRLGLDGSVEWMGQTSDVPGALRDSSVFVQSSRGEGFPLALLEAMAFAVPCAAFDCAPGVREIIRDGEDGLLAAPGNTAELAKQLVRLTSNQELRDCMGEAARVNVARYSKETILEKWEELFALLER